MKILFLTKQFYDDYSECKEIEHKQHRPYIQVIIKFNNNTFAIPMRSNISHKFAFFTDKSNKCGLDFTKVVVITKEEYIDKNARPYIRPNEREVLLGNEYKIQTGLKKYIKEYQKAKKSNNKYDKQLCEYSTLQYFEDYL